MEAQEKPASTAILIESSKGETQEKIGRDSPLSMEITVPSILITIDQQLQEQPKSNICKQQVLTQLQQQKMIIEEQQSTPVEEQKEDKEGLQQEVTQIFQEEQQQPLPMSSATQQQPLTKKAHQPSLPATSSVLAYNRELSEILLNPLLEESEFEKQCRHNLDHQYENWKTNGWGKPPICIPDAIEVNKAWFYRTLDPHAADYGKRVTQEKAEKLKGALAERDVHQAFQKSTIGGILIHGLDFGTLWKKLKLSIPPEIYQQLEPHSRMGSFEIDFLLFHPVYGMVVMECKSVDMSTSGKKAYKKHKKMQKETIEKLLNVFKILTGTDFPPEFVHGLLCFPNSEKTNIKESEHGSILDKFDLTDKLLFDSFWNARLAAAQHLQCPFENSAICRFIAMAFGCRVAKFISLGCNALEIHRIIDSHESSRHLNQTIAFNATNATTASSTSNKKIFLNSEQLIVYGAAKYNSNMVIYGPPGCGKTLLVMMLAKKASELKKPGRVVIILAYNELAAIFENFFNANKSKQKRTILINPSASEIEKSLAINSFDDIFSDEVYYGGWIPRKKRENGRTVVGLTIGRQHHKWSMTYVANNLKIQLKDADFDFFELKTVMRNTGNICDYYQQYTGSNQIHIGHNIRGRAVKVIECDNVKRACTLIIDQIRQLLKNSDELNQELPMLSCKDIAVLVCHEPVLCQIKQIKRSLRNAGIDVGSIAEQLQKSSIQSSVAVDCSAHSLSCEWPVVFVIDASPCRFSQNVSSPIVAFTRAVCALFVIKTQECNYPHYIRKPCSSARVCNKVSSSVLSPFQEFHYGFHENDIANEFSFIRTTRLMQKTLYWFIWLYFFVFLSVVQVFNLIALWLCPEHDVVASTIYSVCILIYLFIDIFCARASLLAHPETTSLLWRVFYLYSIFLMIMSVGMPPFDGNIFIVYLLLALVLLVCERGISYSLHFQNLGAYDPRSYFENVNKTSYLIQIYIKYNISFIIIVSGSFLFIFAHILKYGLCLTDGTLQFIILYFALFQYTLYKQSFRPTLSKCVKISSLKHVSLEEV